MYATHDGYNITGHYEVAQPGSVPLTHDQWQLSCAGRLRIVAGLPVEYVPPGPTLDDLKTAKTDEINTARAEAINAGIEHNGHRWQTDKTARENITGTLSAVNAGVQLPAEFTWRTEDNQDVPMDATWLTALAAAVLAHVNAQYTRSWALKAQTDAATTAAEVQTITW
jgi:hypothetical protein